MDIQLDRLLAAYCAPALIGIKPANLVACDRALVPDLPRKLRIYREAFAARGVRFEIVCACETRYLLLVYHVQSLTRQMCDPRVRLLLSRFGYPDTDGLAASLYHLKRRMAQNDGFPHEIGLFLGYPVEDVEGFIEKGGRGCKLTGHWKVYGDAEAASKQFERLSRVSRAVTRRVERGESLLEVFAA